MTSKVRSGGQAALSPRGSSSTAARGWPSLFASLLLACLLAQATLVQSHLHFVGRPAPSPIASSGRSAQASIPVKGDLAADCLLCHEAAMAGAYLLPTAAVVPVAAPFVLWLFDAPVAAFGLPAPAFGWLSRAPPK